MDKFKHDVLAKAINPEEKTIEHYASTYQWDRDGERFVKGCWELENYRKNPVVLWGHDHHELPIGTNVGLVEDETGLKVTTKFDEKSERSMEIFRLLKDGILNAFSVGFIRKAFQMEDQGNGQKGLAITKAELYEYSVVGVPANPGCLVSRESAEIAQKCLGEGVVEILRTKAFGDQFMIVNPITPPPPAEAVTEIGADQLEPVIKQLIELARACKGQQLPEQKRALVSTAMSVFNELLSEQPEELTVDQLKDLKDALVRFAGVLADVRPELATPIQKAISQIDSALTGRAA